MAPIEIYPALKAVHVSLVACSGALFAGRGAARLAGRSGVMDRRWRWLSYAVDTLLLAAGLSLWALLGLHLSSSPWLAAKLALLVVYIVLGSFALKRARSPAGQRASYGAALLVFLFIASIAWTHRPLGAISPLLRPAS